MTFALKKKLLLSLNRPIRPQDVFATSLYTGNGGTQTITNGLDLAGKGGLVWAKRRDSANDHALADTVRGPQLSLASNTTAADFSNSTGLTAFLANGYTTGALNTMNANGGSYASWSFRRARKFFDIVTYTGNGQSGRQIPHELDDVPGMIVVKRRNNASNWMVLHRSIAEGSGVKLNTAEPTGTGYIDGATTTTFKVYHDSVGEGNGNSTNINGATYVAYLFAHNPDLIDCGTYVGNGLTNGPSVTCGNGWRPQYLLIKNATSAASWILVDTPRGFSISNENVLSPNTANGESLGQWANPSDVGFFISSTHFTVNSSGNKYIYMAIRSPT